MSLLTIPTLKAAFSKLGYVWDDNGPNLIGIRTALMVPDVFNDLFVAVFRQPGMAAGANLLSQQRFLNYWGFRGENGVPLKEDGVDGRNTQFALSQFAAVVGRERLMAWTCTTVPGLYYLRNPVPGGAAVVVPGQYRGIYNIGFHQNRKDHPALVQRGGEIRIYRDNDRDNFAEETRTIQSGYFGINIHRANLSGTTPRIGNWSAGCQVFARAADHAQLMRICSFYQASVGNRFTYTLLRERELST